MRVLRPLFCLDASMLLVDWAAPPKRSGVDNGTCFAFAHGAWKLLSTASSLRSRHSTVCRIKMKSVLYEGTFDSSLRTVPSVLSY